MAPFERKLEQGSMGLLLFLWAIFICLLGFSVYYPTDPSRILLKLSLFSFSQLSPSRDPRLSHTEVFPLPSTLSASISADSVPSLDLSRLLSHISSFFSIFPPTRQFQTLKFHSPVLLTCYMVASCSIHSLLYTSFLILSINFSV